jgi:hypothetical protein
MMFSMSSPLSKMSGGDVDVEPFLVSRNTLGNDEPQLKFSKPNAAKFVWNGCSLVVGGFCVSMGLRKLGGGGRSGYAEA